VIFPERSDNCRLNDALFGDFVRSGIEQGYTVYTNCYFNSNYTTSPALPDTTALVQLSLAEIIAIASDPTNILIGTRSGVFDVLYFVMPEVAARLIVLYPPEPAWLWDTARFRNDHARSEFPQFYFDRQKVLEIRTRDFNGGTLSLALRE